MVRLIAWLMIGSTLLLSTGWALRLSEKAWVMNQKDATTLGLYAAVLASAAIVLIFRRMEW